MSISNTSSRSTASAVRTSYGEIAYQHSGSGPVALFIHGVFLNSGLWRGQLAALGDLRHCVAVDLLAHGRSDCPARGELSLSMQADMIREFLGALGVDEADLVGNDTGGAIAQLVAVRAPGQVRSLTLTNCDTHDNWPPPAFASIVDLARAGTLAGGLATLAGHPHLGRAALAGSLEHPEAVADEVISGFFAPFADPVRARVVQAYIAGMDCGVTVAIRDDLARLHAPTLIVWGTSDEFFDVSWARWLAATIPGAAAVPGRTGVITLDGAKLLHPLERPGDLNRGLRELWSAPGPGVPGGAGAPGPGAPGPGAPGR
jgi:pimeloyl-ACP methyl ester carboxylesterase